MFNETDMQTKQKSFGIFFSIIRDSAVIIGLASLKEA